jgi:hypothetical protein
VMGGVVSELYGTPFWFPLPVLLVTLASRRVYLSTFTLSVILALLGGTIH